MDSTDIYVLPNVQNIDGLNLGTEYFGCVFDSCIDGKRLSRENEVLVATYPRTGTTWLTQIVSLLINGENKFEETKKTHLQDRVPYLEQQIPGHSKPFIDQLERFPVARVDKTHLPYRFISRWICEDKIRTIVTTRNPKDTMVSYYHFYRSLKGFGPFTGTWDDFFRHVKAGYQLYGDQLHWFQDWNKNKDKGEILFLKYEGMKQDLLLVIHKIARFLQLNVSDEFVSRIMDASGINAMKKDAGNFYDVKFLTENGKFLRKGESGEWKKYFTVAQNEWFDAKYKEAYTALDIEVDYN